MSLLETGTNLLNRPHGLISRAFRPGLRLKLLVLVSSISLVGVLISTFLLFNIQRRQIIQNAEANTSTLGSTIKANLKHAMVTVDRKMTNDLLKGIVAEETVDAVRILNAQGVVTESALPSEVGKQYSQSQPACQICHSQNTTITDKTVIFTENSGRQILLNVNLLENESECQACHANEGKVLGVLMLESPLNGVQQQLRSAYFLTGFLALGTFALLVGVLVLALRRFIIEPVEQLEKGVAEISVGNLEGQIQTTNDDELGRLAESLNTMRKQLKASNAEMQERHQELLVLNEVAMTVSQSLDLQEVLNRALDTLTEKLGVEASFIRLADKETGRATLRASRGASEALCSELERRRSNPEFDFSSTVMKTGETYFLPCMTTDRRLDGLWERQDARSFVLTPLKNKGKVVGTLSLVSHAGQPMNDRIVVVMEAIANEIGIAIDNAQLLAEAHLNEQEAVTLYQLGSQVSASLALRDVLKAVAEAARKLFDADMGMVGLIDDQSEEVVLRAAAGLRAESLVGRRLPVKSLSTAGGLMRGEPVMTGASDGSLPVIFDEALVKEENITSFLTAPLERGGQVLGLVQVMTRQQRRFLQRDAHLLMRLAHHVVVAIENAQLYRRLRYLAVLEERDRIAGEMHDHLSQTLGYMNIKTSMLDDLLIDGKVEKAREGLIELKDAAKIAYTDVREAIFNLRTPVSSGGGLMGSIREYLSEYKTYYGLDTCMDMEDEDLIEINPEQAAQLLRIIQEALVNVRKHAEANKVRITCQPAGAQVCVIIEDNGRGFALDQIPGADKQHFGLQIMRERAESVGGGLELDSQPGHGTRVIVRMPIRYQSEEGI